VLRVAQKRKQFDFRHHAGEFSAVFKRRVTIQHTLNLVSHLEWCFSGRVIWIALFGEVENLVQLDDDLIDQFFLVRVFIILFHELEKFNNHVTSQQTIDG